MPLIEPGQTVYWVNDQVTGQAARAPRSRSASPRERRPRASCRNLLQQSRPRPDTISPGRQVTGTVKNESKIDQADLILFAVARQGGQDRGGRRGQIKTLKADAKPANYTIFFIGDPKGADVTIKAPPTILH